MDFKKMLGADFGKVDSKYGLRLTMLGIGVLTKDGQLSVYDKKAKTITTVPDDLSIGDIPFFAFPADKLEIGDLVIHNGAIKSITDADDGGLVAVNIKSQVEEIIIVSKNLFGFKGVSKITSLISPDSFGGGDGGLFGGDLTKNPMLMMMLMGGGDLFGGDSDDSFLPLMLMSQMGGGAGGFGDLAKNPMLMMMLMKGL